MTNLVSNGYFLAKRTYQITDNQTKQPKDLITYDLLVYEDVKDWGVTKPQIVKITRNANDPIDMKGISVFSKVLVNFELKVTRVGNDNFFKPSYTSFELVK